MHATRTRVVDLQTRTTHTHTYTKRSYPTFKALLAAVLEYFAQLASPENTHGQKPQPQQQQKAGKAKAM